MGDSAENQKKKKPRRRNRKKPQAKDVTEPLTGAGSVPPQQSVASPATTPLPENITSPPSTSSTVQSLSSDLLPPQKRLTPSGKPHFPGRQGSAVLLATNHFPLSLPTGLVYQYTVTIQPPWTRPYRRSDKSLYQQVIQKWRSVCPPARTSPYSWVYDGDATLYCTKAHTNIPNCNVTVQVQDREMEFCVADVKLAKTVPISQDIADWAARGQSGNTPQTALHALDVILAQAVVTDLQYTTVGRSYFRTGGQVLDIGLGKEVWTGLFSSVRPHSWDKQGTRYLATLNVDVSNKPATKQIHLTRDSREEGECYVQQVLGRKAGRDWRKGLTRQQVEILDGDMKGLKVRYELPNGSKRQYKCNGFVNPANKQIIPDLKQTVEQFFQATHKVRLSYPGLPCLWLGPVTKTIYIPMELCIMMAQPMPRHKLLQEESVSKMIRTTAVTPWERQDRIMKGLQKNNSMYKKDPYAKEFGINVAGSMAQLTGRLLPPPTIAYDKGKQVKIASHNPGKWVQRSQEHLYVSGMQMKYWAVLDLARLSESQYGTMVEQLVNVGRGVGLKISSGSDNLMRWESSEQSLERDFEKLVVEFKMAETELEMVMIVMPFKAGQVYDMVKKLGDLKFKIPTQCCLKRNIFKPGGEINLQVLSNICLKLNSKLGGINHVLAPQSRPALLDRPVMIMGADVTHPAPAHKGHKPSIAAVVASVDPKASRYEVQIRVQDSGQNEEMIQDMKNVVKILLGQFRLKTGHKPEALVMFRDGVSEGQFTTVMAMELMAIRTACKELEENYEPRITYLVVQKRHHTRFFPMDQNQYRNGNALAGTVVDQGINHPTEGDFYLLSHEGIQGTSRPCHYHVLWDDSNLTADQLEVLAYFLCHLYTRCTRSVSYPAPTYYSHLAADRARKHHDQLLEENLGKERAKEIIEQAKTNLMYFV
eukprot:GFUD01037510.1.p1 GENE.GFUD01037510.1~~GFUD01037510.1.p1  ORF type:complete len:930 (+),score=334.94 GFUD01037510.1:83-2872(+)